MLAVLGRRHDASARRIVERLAPSGAGTITIDDLSLSGWRFRPHAPDDFLAIVDGEVVSRRELTGVVTRLPYIDAAELTHIVPEDRSYVAAEMHAFLKAWLTSLSCPVLNRPNGDCLSGPAWGPSQWNRAAAQCGLTLPTRNEEIVEYKTVTIVGSRWFGDVHSELVQRARVLANRVGVDLLEVRFAGNGSQSVFAGACPWPRLETDEAIDTVASYFFERAGSPLQRQS